MISKIRCSPDLAATVMAGLSLLFGLPRLGLAGVDRWTLAGTIGQSIEQVIVDPLAPANLFALTERSVWKSTDGGRSWSALGQPRFVSSLVIDPTDSAHLYAVFSQALWTSDDAGETWRPLNPIAPYVPGDGGSLTIDPTEPSRIAYRSGFREVLLSEDGGRSFEALVNEELQESENNRAGHELLFDAAGTLVLRTPIRGLFVWSPASGRWQARSLGLPRVGRTVDLAVHPTQAGRWILVYQDGRLFETLDSGKRWERIGRSPNDLELTVLDYSPAEPERLWGVSASGVHSSRDGGHTWVDRTPDLPGFSPERPFLAVTPHPTRPDTALAAPRHGGLLRTTNGGVSWTRRDRGVDGNRPGRILPTTGLSREIWITSFRLWATYSSRDRGRHWKAEELPPGFEVIWVDPADPGRRFTSAGWTVDGGETYERPEMESSCLFAESLTVHPSDRDLMFLQGFIPRPCFEIPDLCTSLRSTDGGKSFSCIDGGHSPELIFDGEDGSIVHAGTSTSFDRGATWTPAGLGLVDIIEALLADPGAPGTYFASTLDGLFVSHDSGATYEKLNGDDPEVTGANGLPGGRAGSLGVDPTSTGERPDLLVVFPETGLFRSRDGGASWEIELDGLDPNRITGPLVADPLDPGTLYLGTLDGLMTKTRRTTSACLPDDTTLCLAGGRYRVEVEWRDFEGNDGVGRTRPLTDDTGAFWFFKESNLELMVKIFDGSPLNQMAWFFYGALSTVEYRIDVTDTATGALRSYYNPPRSQASRGDTNAFELGEALPLRHRSEQASSPASLRAHPGGDHCDVTSRTLCLAGRFRIEVEWTDFQGESGHGTAVPLTDDTGVFWFFNEENLELMIKVLDGRTVNGHFWVFYGALSNVGYTIRVIDVENGQSKTYVNPLRRFASRADTRAF